ncbi:carbohydrate ABC transporter permease [Microbacterium rhizosphaerae]|uniref:Sugar ABC transporter permease n=1 Tax=Microbacterium rhizosphaerae TaxID=1678237 RepID=A0ABZ0SLG9_9MICO|nr:sugar ABC transporter permease [Microbacterium rhizosphaerae]WPR89443.1 sugar ABC transporter permease [Microbacterium rhizosphaerae]
MSTHAQSAKRSLSPERSNKAGYLFVAGYTILLVAFGVVPTVYALALAFTNDQWQFTGLGQFMVVVTDFRFARSMANLGAYIALWLTAIVVFAVGLALILRNRVNQRMSVFWRFLFYLPGALAGVASALVWMFMLSPQVSPVAPLLHAIGWTDFGTIVQPQNLPAIFTVMAFWVGAGGWIIIMYGAVNNISDEVMEAARIDGASSWQLAWHIQIPMIRQWIVYMVILAFAAGTQIFVEPQMLGVASKQVDITWSPNQLAYQFAFGPMSNANAAAALSVLLLAVGLVVAVLLVTRSGLFTVEAED